MKRFHIYIKDNETGDELVNQDSDCIIGAVSDGESETDGQKGMCVNKMHFCACDGKELIFSIETTQKTIDEIKNKILARELENPESPVSKLKAFLDSLKKEEK